MPPKPAFPEKNAPEGEGAIINEVEMQRLQMQQNTIFSWNQLPQLLPAFSKILCKELPAWGASLKDLLIRSAVFCAIVILGGNYAGGIAKEIWEKQDRASTAKIRLATETDLQEKKRFTSILAEAGEWDALTQLDDPAARADCLKSLKNENDPDALVIAATAMMMQMDGYHEDKEFLALFEKAAEKGSVEAMFFLCSWYESGGDESTAKKYRKMCNDLVTKAKERKQ